MEVEFDDYVRMVRAFWRSILAATVAAGVIGWAVSATEPVEYTASSRVLFVGPDGPTTQFAVLTYRDLVTTSQVLGPAAAEVGLEAGGVPLAGRVSVAGSPGSAILTISVTDADADAAARIANGVAATLIKEAAALEGAASDTPITQGSIVDAAAAPGSPTSPDTRLYVVGAAFAGFLAGLGQALLRYWRSRQVRA